MALRSALTLVLFYGLALVFFYFGIIEWAFGSAMMPGVMWFVLEVQDEKRTKEDCIPFGFVLPDNER